MKSTGEQERGLSEMGMFPGENDVNTAQTTVKDSGYYLNLVDKAR